MKIKRFFVAWGAIALLSGLSGAQEKTPPKTPPKKSYTKKAETKVQEWNTKVESLEKRSEKAGTKTRSELDRHVKTLEEKLEIIRKKLSEFQAAAKKTLSELKHAYHEASSFFNKSGAKEVP